MIYKQSPVISAASDGACSGNPGPGGWGALIRFEDGTVKEFGGYEPATTNNRMELQGVLAILKNLESLPRHPNMTIRTDSKYVINGFNNWIKGWKRNGWRTASGKPVLNQDLWEALDQARIADVDLEFVKGHNGDPDNERVDKIAVSYSKGTSIKPKSTKSSVQNKVAIEPLAEKIDPFMKPGPRKLQRLLSRLEMATKIAKHGYSLTTEELSELLETTTTELSKKKHSWQWRDWLVERSEDSKWRLKLQKQTTTSSKEGQDAKNT